MKTYKLNILLVLVLMLFMQACQDKFLELEPKTNKLEANSYVTENDALLALAAVYDVMSHQEVLNFQPFRSDIYSDDTFTAGEPPSGGMLERWGLMELSRLDAESATCSEVWRRCYRGVYRANQYLSKEAGIEWKNNNLRDRMIAEIKFLRAYFYWDLVRHFGWVPLVEGIITAEEARTMAQVEPEEIYKYLAKDLLEAIEGLPLKVEPNEFGRATKGAARVLMARIWLYYEGFCKNTPELNISNDWSDGETVISKAMVQQEIEAIINGEGEYVLLDNYADVHDWANENNAESIFEIQYSEKSQYDGWASGATTEQVDGNTTCQITGPRNPRGDTIIAGGWSFGMLSWSLVNEFEPGDTRYEVTVFDGEVKLFVIDNNGDTLRGWENGAYTPGYHNTGYFNRKYVGLAEYRSTESQIAHNYPKNFIDMRYAEVLLIAAELFYEEDNAKATAFLNQVRTRAMGESAALTSITLDDIYHERRVELACEGQRYWDILRRGLDYAEQKVNESFIPDPSYPTPADFDDYYFNPMHLGMIPIPADEIRNSNKGVLEQKIDFYR